MSYADYAVDIAEPVDFQNAFPKVMVTLFLKLEKYSIQCVKILGNLENQKIYFYSIQRSGYSNYVGFNLEQE